MDAKAEGGGTQHKAPRAGAKALKKKNKKAKKKRHREREREEREGVHIQIGEESGERTTGRRRETGEEVTRTSAR